MSGRLRYEALPLEEAEAISKLSQEIVDLLETRGESLTVYINSLARVLCAMSLECGVSPEELGKFVLALRAAVDETATASRILKQ